jgi:hypothetical protein
MPDFKTGCIERLSGGSHDHSCYREPGDAGVHAGYCGIRWDNEGRLSVLRTSWRRR